MELESDSYDVVVIGTGVAESIAAAALAKTGRSVLHLDPNEYYGGEQASLTLDELQKWSKARGTSDATLHSSSSTYMRHQRARYGWTQYSEADERLLVNRRRYALSLFPAIVPSRGPLIDTLISSGVSKYVSFRMLDSVSVWDEENAAVRRVPGSKEQVFKDKDISLMEKRRLMKFLLFTVGEFENDELVRGKETHPFQQFLQESFTLPPHLAAQVAYAIAHCSSSSDSTGDALRRTRRYLKSIGRYGNGAFLIGQYGGASEIAQGFCRACAVFGGTYVLGPDSIPETIEVVDGSEPVINLKLPCHPRTITARRLITSGDHLPDHLAPRNSTSPSIRIAQCIALASDLPDSLRRPKAEPTDDEQEEEDQNEDDTAVVVFPPSADDDGTTVRALLMGEGTGSCLPGQFVLYLSSESSGEADPKSTLQPYLHRLCSSPLYESYYASAYTPSTTTASTLLSSPAPPIVLLNPYHGLGTMTEGLDWEAAQGEAAFWAVAGDPEKVETGQGFFDKTEADEEVEDADDM